VSVAKGGAIFELQEGALRHVTSYDDLVARNGARPLTIFDWSSATASRVGYAPPILDDRSVVQFTGSGEVYLLDAGTLRYIRTYDAYLALGSGGKPPKVTIIDASFRSAYPVGPPL
jgi:hypothetical protein